MVIIAEDSRFRTHHGIDFVELRGAWAAGSHRGASTLTQQLAKNLYLSPSRSIFRKVKEAVTAVRLELALSKDRIMTLYLDNAELGPGVWGATAASEAYYSGGTRGDAAAAAHVQSGVSAGENARAPRFDLSAVLRRKDPRTPHAGRLDPRYTGDRASHSSSDPFGLCGRLANPPTVAA